MSHWARCHSGETDGGSYSTLEVFTGVFGGSGGSRTLDLTPFIAVDTRIRFRVSASYGGSNEEFQVDFVEVEGCPVAAPAMPTTARVLLFLLLAGGGALALRRLLHAD